MPQRVGISTMLVGLLAALAGSGVDDSVGIFYNIFHDTLLLQQAGPERLPELRTTLEKAHIGLSVKVFADGRAQDNRLSVGVHGCYVERRCPDDSVAAARALARHTNAPPLVWEWIDVYEMSLEVSDAPLPMLGFGVADDGAKLYISRSAHSEEYPPLPFGRRLALPDVLRAHNFTDGLALKGVSLEWSVEAPNRSVRVRIYHSEPAILSALYRWGSHHNISRVRLSVWAAQLAQAAPHAQLIWTSPLYDPFAQLEPPRLFPTKLAIKAPARAWVGGKRHSLETSSVQVGSHMSDIKCRAREGGRAREARVARPCATAPPPPVCTMFSPPVLRPWTGASEE